VEGSNSTLDGASRVRVAFDLTVVELDAAGTARAVRELARALEARPDVELVPVAHPVRPRGPRGRIARGLDRELRWLPFGLPRRARARGADVLHCPAALGPPRVGVPLVLTVNDLLALDHPQWFTRANALQQRLLIGRLARRARAVIVPSEDTRRRLLERLGPDQARVHVVPYGVGPPFSPGPPDRAVLARLGVAPPYVLTVATLQPRKNLDAALRAHAELAAAGVDVQLVVAGGRGWRDAALAARLAGTSRVLPTGRIDDAELVALLRGAELLVHPSRHEGFGFPPLEAMACGTPVVAARAASLPELVGDAGELVDVDAPGALADTMQRVLGDARLRGQTRERGLRRAAAFTWARCAERHVAIYRRALEG
jgi:glycosyltransferase involved in cell wall biosynthesis